jgi:hypothetical protein
MVEAITSQASGERRYTATSMYRAWNGWSFSDKKHPSPWLALLVLRMLKRSFGDGEGRADQQQKPEHESGTSVH